MSTGVGSVARALRIACDSLGALGQRDAAAQALTRFMDRTVARMLERLDALIGELR